MITLSGVHWLYQIAKGVCDRRKVKKPGSESVNKKIFHCGGSEIALFLFFFFTARFPIWGTKVRTTFPTGVLTAYKDSGVTGIIHCCETEQKKN